MHVKDWRCRKRGTRATRATRALQRQSFGRMHMLCENFIAFSLIFTCACTVYTHRNRPHASAACVPLTFCARFCLMPYLQVNIPFTCSCWTCSEVQLTNHCAASTPSHPTHCHDGAQTQAVTRHQPALTTTRHKHPQRVTAQLQPQRCEQPVIFIQLRHCRLTLSKLRRLS